MTEERLTHVLRVYEAVLAREGAERAAYLDTACGADAELRREVEALVAEPSAGPGSLLDTPPWSPPPALAPGQRLGPYEVTSLLGAGGMGTVYKARDTRLHRTVALKLLSGAGALDPAARDRFTREAQAIAALDHPNICAIHDIGRDGASDYLVMEHVEGETLAARLQRGALPVAEAVAVGAQIVGALEAAHRQGIVHRDLKPANVMLVVKDRIPQVKLLDFGLAKFERPAGASASQNRAVLESTATGGAVIGTVCYMAPEQLEGKAVDARADLFSFGCVFHEMLAGRRAFGGDSQAAVISAIMSGQPPRLPTSVSRACPALDEIVRRCLAKDRADRWGSAADVAERLGPLSRPAARPSRWSFATLGGRIRLLVAAAAMVGLVGSAWLVTNRLMSRVSGPIAYSLTMPGRTALSAEYGASIVAAQDGSGVVYRGGDSGRIQLYWGDLSGGEGWALAGTDGATNPFLSEDARWLGFSRGGKLQKLPLRAGHVVEGSEAADIAGIKRAAQGRGAAWAADGGLVYGANGTGLWYLPAGGAEARALTRLDPSKQEMAHGWPTFLPGDRLVLFTILDASGRFDRSSIALLSLDTGRWNTIVQGGGYARYVPSGHIVYARKSSLVAVPFDIRSGRTTGAAIPVRSGIGFLVNQLTATFDVTRDGSLVFAAVKQQALENTLVWVDRNGSPERAVSDRRFYSGNQQAVSPDGQRIATVVYADPDDEIWIYHLQEKRWQELAMPGDSHFPLWSPNGDRLVFISNRDGAWNLYVVSADGEGAPTRLTQSEHFQWPYAWSRDGRFVAYQESDPESPGLSTINTWILPAPLDGTTRPWRWGPEGVMTTIPSFSPDGRWLAYQSKESGTLEVYARPFPGPGPKHRISGKDGGLAPLWSADGREIFYMTRLGDNRIMSRGVESSVPLRLSEPHVAFALPFRVHAPMDYHARAFTVTPDGRRVLVMQTDERTPDRVTSLTVLRAWAAELKSQVPDEAKQQARVE